MHLLVTGGAGFIGSNFVHYVVANTDARLTVLDKMTYAASREAFAGLPGHRVHLIAGDAANPPVANNLLGARFRSVQRRPARRGRPRRYGSFAPRACQAPSLDESVWPDVDVLKYPQRRHV